MKKENKQENIIVVHSGKDKDRYYEMAINYWKVKDFENAEEWAIRAMRAGSRNLAPKLLADLAICKRSKSTAITLASFYWELEEVEKAIHWAKISKEYGSRNSADKLIAEITAHLEAVEIHKEVGRLSK